MEKKYSLLSIVLFAALFLVGCSDEHLDEPTTPNTDIVPEREVTYFVSGGGTRTVMDNAGHHHWVNGDKIWIRVGDKFVASDSMSVSDTDTQWADFMFWKRYEDDSYPLVYAGSNTTQVDGTSGKKEFEVTIPSKQIQKSPNNSEHFAASGDCAIASADKQADGTYKFKLRHQMTYLVFEPRTNSDTDVKLTRIKITEINGKNICGTFRLNEDTCDISNVENGSNVIEIICGENVEKAEADPQYAGSVNNGFTLKKTADPTNNRVYAVIRPNNPGEEYELKVEFEMVYYMVQTTVHDEGALNWGYTYVMHKHPDSRDLRGNFKPNTYKTARQVLSVPAPPAPDYTYNFEEYYMWGATNWFWKQAVDDGHGYPFYNDEHQVEGQPTEGSDSWYDDNYPVGYTVTGSYGANYFDGNLHYTNSGMRHRQAQWSDVLTANQMSYYVKYGDPHYDNTTSWALKTYNGVYTICYGGVWLKTKAAILRDNPGLTWPNGSDDSRFGNLSAYDNNGNGKYYNLRYFAPANNFRTNYSNPGQFDKKPWELDSNKKKEDYFFLPCLGRIEYSGKGTADKWNGAIVPGTSEPTMTLVGSQGFYWTKTPVMYNLGTTRWCRYIYDGDTQISDQSGLDIFSPTDMKYHLYEIGSYNDNAFYFNIHWDYIALSWQQLGIYVKTGMRKATTSIFK